MQLEEKRLHGSVQRLIRARDNYDETPLDHANAEVARLLEQELSDAVSRDGGVMYGFDTASIREMRARRDNALVSDELSLKESFFGRSDPECASLIANRRRDLEQEYKAKQRELGLAIDGSQKKMLSAEIAEVFARICGDHT